MERGRNLFKKLMIVIIMIFVIIILVIGVSYKMNLQNLQEIVQENKQYEAYLDKQIFGTDVITVINKATDENIKNNIAKDDKGFFIENDTNSIKVELVMLNQGEKATYQMETIKKVGTSGFIKNFNLIYFKCTNIEYHDQTKKVKKIVFEQLEE